MSKGHQISRRSVLKGVGTTIALPFLDAMLPSTLSAANPQAALPKRLGFIYVPNGVIVEDWFPRKEGANFDLPTILKPLAPHQDDVLVLSNLACDKARPNGDGPGDHARASGAYLTGVQPRKTAGANFQVGISADQVAAKALGDRTRIPSLEIAVDSYRGSGNCDSGYACVYQHTLAWRGPSSPLPTETDPKLVFNRLFSDKPNSPERAKETRLRSSVLDAVLADAKSLQTQLGGADKQKLDQYLTAVRELENRLARVEKQDPVRLPTGTEKPTGLPADLSEHFKLMCDLMVLAYQTDVTRICTFMFGREGSNQRYKMVGVSEGHHELTHHRNDPKMMDKVRKINVYHMQQFAYLLEKLKAVKEGEGTLLDACLLTYGSGNADGNKHTHHDLPILLAGKGGGTLKPGRHIRYERETPVNNLWLSLLDRFGSPTPKLGDSTGLLRGLS